MNQNTTIIDVAKRSGVSRGTVSRVLNGSTRVSILDGLLLIIAVMIIPPFLVSNLYILFKFQPDTGLMSATFIAY